MTNRVVLIGRLTADPVIRTTQNGVSVASFNIAVDRKFKNQSGEKETDFIPIVAWRGLADNCGRYLSKGKMAAVDGRLQVRSYEDKDGNRRTIAEVIAETIEFLSPKDSVESTPNEGYGELEEMEPLDDIPF